MEWLIANGKKDKKIQKKLDERTNEYKVLQQKHAAYLHKTHFFNQYWWADKDMSFNQLRKDANFSDNYLYNISCYRVHAGMVNLLKFDNSEEGLLVGACEGGKEIPMLFALLNLYESTNKFFSLENQDSSVILLKIDQLLDMLKAIPWSATL